MGLIKKIGWKGYEPEYWFIVEATPNLKTNKTTIGLALYKDAQTRAIDKNKLDPSWENIIGRQNYPSSIHTVIAKGIGLTYEEMYNAVKTNEENKFFWDAVDELEI